MAFPFLRQFDQMDCGPTCLSMVAKFYNKEVSIPYLRTKVQIGKEGVSLLSIFEAAENIGFKCAAIQTDTASLKSKVTFPVILHWNQNHFVVLYKIKKDKFYISDPAKGLLIFSHKDFASYWICDRQGNKEEGISLLLEPSENFKQLSQNNLNSPVKKSLFTYLWQYKKFVFKLCFSLFVVSLIQVIFPFLTLSVVDIGIKTADIELVNLFLLAQLFLFVGKTVVEFVRSWILLHISARINLSILSDFLVKLMSLPIPFFDSKKTGDILQRMNDHTRIESFLTGASLNTIFSTINLIVFSIILATFHIHIFNIFFCCSTAYGLWFFLFLHKRKQLDHKRFDLGANERSSTIQLIQGMQEIKLSGIEKSVQNAWAKLQLRLLNLNIQLLSLTQWQLAGTSFINEGKNILITFIAAKSVIAGDMTLGTMIAVSYIIGQLNSPLEQIIGFVQNFQNAKLSLDRLNEVHSMDGEESNTSISILKIDAPSQHQNLNKQHYNPIKKEEVDGEYAFKIHNLSFTYPGAGNFITLKNINLAIPRNKITAIVGMSGSGKTTLLKLLLKFYEPQQGHITFGTLDIKEITHQSWRKQIGVVMQDSFIFSDTITRNIAVGDGTVDQEMFDRAAEVANINEFTEDLPLGFNTKIGPEGNSLSMGQRQRVLIARAIYKSPQIILFDEATNSLDANNENKILHQLEHFFHGKTVIMIAHRLSTVKSADQIIVMHKGEIVEKGKHESLIKKRGCYYELVKNQLEIEE